MTDKEKLDAIRAEIHRLVDVRGYDREMANDLFAFMNSLPNEPASERLAFKAIPRLLEMIEPTDRAKEYIAKLADTLEVEGYSTDAKIVMESLKIMNGEKVPMATMDEEPVSEDLEKNFDKYSEGIESVYSNDMFDRGDIMRACKFGAQCQKEQIMAKAIDAQCFGFQGAALFSFKLPADKYLVGSKVKVFVIKDD